MRRSAYAHTFVTHRETRIATIPVGYADGYPRALSSKGRVIVNGQFAPIIGRVCMDQFMIDVTDIEGELNIEDEVILMGSDNGCTISAEEIGNMSASFNYEFVSMGNDRSRFPLTKRKFIPLAMAQRTRSHFQSFSFYFFASFIRLRFSSRMRSRTMFTALSTSALGMRASR